MRRKIILGAAAVALLGLGLSAYPGSPIREAAATVIQDRECWLQEAPHGAADRTVAIGDSITVGRHNDTLRVGANNSYFDVLACRADSPISFVANEGIGHNTTSMMATRLQADVLSKSPDQVFVLGGTNDVILGEEDQTVANLEMIRAAVAATGARPIFGLLPPLDSDPAAVVALNEEVRSWATDNQVTLVDYWTPLADGDGTYRAGMSEDGIHPSPTAAKLMADETFSALE